MAELMENRDTTNLSHTAARPVSRKFVDQPLTLTLAKIQALDGNDKRLKLVFD